MADDGIMMSVAEYRGSLVTKEGYERIPTRKWMRDECLAWLWDVGATECSANYLTDEELIEEVLLQKAAMGM